MSKPSPTPGGGPAVSKARTIVSLILLLVVGVVCVIELRAGLGHWMTANAMKGKCNDQGEFENLTLQDAQGLVKFGPAVKENSQDADVSFRYTWFSLLRPVMGDPSPGLTLVATKGEKPMALTFHTDAEEEAAAPAPTTGTEASPANASTGGMMGPGGMGGPGGGMMPGGMMGGPGGPGGPGGGMMGGPGGGRRERPPVEDEGSDTAAPTEGTATDKPVEDQPAEEKPADSPSSETPTEETPTEETPAEEKPADNAAETPAEPK